MLCKSWHSHFYISWANLGIFPENKFVVSIFLAICFCWLIYTLPAHFQSYYPLRSALPEIVLTKPSIETTKHLKNNRCFVGNSYGVQPKADTILFKKSVTHTWCYLIHIAPLKVHRAHWQNRISNKWLPQSQIVSRWQNQDLLARSLFFFNSYLFIFK